MNNKESNKMTEHKKKLQEILDNLLADWADGKIDNPDKAIQQIRNAGYIHHSEVVLDEAKIKEIIDRIDFDSYVKVGIHHRGKLYARAIAQSGNSLVKEKGVGKCKN